MMSIYLDVLKEHCERMKETKVARQRKDFRYITIYRLILDLEKNDNFEQHFALLNLVEKHVVTTCLEQECFFGRKDLQTYMEKLFRQTYGETNEKRSMQMCKVEFNLRFIYQNMKNNRIEYESPEENWREMN